MQSALTFWFDLFLEARTEILENISLVFWKIWRHQKDSLRLTDLKHSIDVQGPAHQES